MAPHPHPSPHHPQGESQDPGQKKEIALFPACSRLLLLSHLILVELRSFHRGLDLLPGLMSLTVWMYNSPLHRVGPTFTVVRGSSVTDCSLSFFPPTSLAILQAAKTIVLSTGYSRSFALSCPLVFPSLVVGRTRTGQMRRVPGKLALG